MFRFLPSKRAHLKNKNLGIIYKYTHLQFKPLKYLLPNKSAKESHHNSCVIDQTLMMPWVTSNYQHHLVHDLVTMHSQLYH